MQEEVNGLFDAPVPQVDGSRQSAERDARPRADGAEHKFAFLFGGEGGVDKIIVDGLVLFSAQKDGEGTVEFSARSADLLIIGDDVGGHLVVDDKADIALIVPHAQLDGRDDRFDLIAGEGGKRFVVALFFSLPRVIRGGFDAAFLQKSRQAVAVAPRQAIDDPRTREFSDMVGDPGEALYGIGQTEHLHGERVPHQRTARDVNVAAELPLQIFHNAVVCGGGRRQYGDPRREQGDDFFELAVVETEVVSPVGDAVCLVDDEQADADIGQAALHVIGKEGLRRDKDKIGPPFFERGEDVTLCTVVVEQGFQLVADFAHLVLNGRIGATLLGYRPVSCLTG